MHSIVCDISPLMEGLWQYQFSTSSWFCERFQFQSLASDSFLTSLSMRQSTEFNLTRRSLHNIRLRSICGWDHSSWHRPTVCGNPNLCVVQYSWQIFCTMSQIFLFLFLFHFLILVQLSEGFQIRPLWYEHLICLRYWGLKPTSMLNSTGLRSY